MTDYSAETVRIEEQERTLVFDSFTDETALELGLAMIDAAKKADAPRICIDISAFGRRVFHYCDDRCEPLNDMWIERKKNTVMLIGHSSLHTAYVLAQAGTTIEQRWHVDPAQYAQIGGSFPIRVKSCGGLIGTITFSGFPHEQDHAFIVSVLENFLKR